MDPEKLQRFRFRYGLLPSEVRLSAEQLAFRSGYRNRDLRIDRLVHLYVDRRSEVWELLLSERRASGALRRLRAHASPGEPAFEALVEALLKLRPEIDIRHLKRAEAHHLTGSRSLEGPALAGLMALGIFLLAIFFLPQLRHGLDGERISISLEQLLESAPEHYNLELEGRLILNQGVRDQRSGRMWFPLLGLTQQEGALASLILEVPPGSIDPQKLETQRRFGGLLRGIYWEGLSLERRAQLEEQGAQLSEEVQLLEYGAEPRDELILTLGILGSLSLLGLMLLYLRRQAHPLRG